MTSCRNPPAQVSSAYERLLVSRATKRLVLGLGQPPGPPGTLSCEMSAGSGVAVRWTPSPEGGQPLFHSYLLEAQPAGQPYGTWVQLADIERIAGEDVVQHIDARLLLRGQRYRVVAWSSYGRSDYVYTRGECAPVYARAGWLALHVGVLALLGLAGVLVVLRRWPGGRADSRRWLSIRPTVICPPKLPLKRANALACVGEGVWVHTLGFLGRARPLAMRLHWFDMHRGNSGEVPLKEPPDKVGNVVGRV